MTHLGPSIAELKARVDLVELVRLSGAKPGKQNKGQKEECWFCCPFHGEDTPSFSVSRILQTFKCLGCGASGDVVTWFELTERLDKKGAIARLKEIAGGDYVPPPPKVDWVKWKQEQEQKRKRDQARALEVWRKAQPIDGTLVEQYLLARGITPGPNGWSPMLRGDVLRYRETVKGVEQVSLWPAMIAAVTEGRRLVTVHRTYLDPDHPGQKAAVKSPKKLMGSPGHGLIRLAPIGDDGLAICGEGIETTLSCDGFGFGAPLCGYSIGHIAGAAVSADRLDEPNFERPGLIWPAGLRELILLRDADVKDQPNIDAQLRRAKRRAEAMGIRCGIASPPDGMDFNDWVRALRGLA